MEQPAHTKVCLLPATFVYANGVKGMESSGMLGLELPNMCGELDLEGGLFAFEVRGFLTGLILHESVSCIGEWA